MLNWAGALAMVPSPTCPEWGEDPIGAFKPQEACGECHAGSHEGKTKLTLELKLIVPSLCLLHIKQLISVPSCEDTGKHAHLHTWAPDDLDAELFQLLSASLENTSESKHIMCSEHLPHSIWV